VFSFSFEFFGFGFGSTVQQEALAREEDICVISDLVEKTSTEFDDEEKSDERGVT
jgi:hypothetical protein